jgi:glycosyltransferase involved in cell wall biosynthesis
LAAAAYEARWIIQDERIELAMEARHIVIVSSIDWDFVWQGHQEIAQRFAMSGNNVLYVENLGVRRPGASDVTRVIRRLMGARAQLIGHGAKEIRPGLSVLSPLVMPPFGGILSAYANKRLFVPRLARSIRRLAGEPFTLISFLPTDVVGELVTVLSSSIECLVYYCIADFEELVAPRNRRRLRQSENQLVSRSDLIFAQGPDLAQKVAPLHGETHVFPFGVAIDSFRVDAPREDLSRLLDGVPHPIVGYVGGIHRHLDFDMISEAIRQTPDWSWVFVGPEQINSTALSGQPNVYRLGQQAHGGLSSLIQRFDACIVPYALNPYTESVFPTKVNEYLAMGRPVVSTALPSLVRFNEAHDVLYLCRPDANEFVGTIRMALEQDDERLRARRSDVAQLHDWREQVNRMAALIDEASLHQSD